MHVVLEEPLARGMRMRRGKAPEYFPGASAASAVGLDLNPKALELVVDAAIRFLPVYPSGHWCTPWPQPDAS